MGAFGKKSGAVELTRRPREQANASHGSVMLAAALSSVAVVGFLAYVAGSVDWRAPTVHAQAAMSVGAVDTLGAPQRVLISRASDGHFWADVSINGHPIRMMVDTGATSVVLSWPDADRIMNEIASNSAQADGAYLRLKRFAHARSVGGDLPVAEVELDDVRISGIGSRNVTALIALKWDPQRPTPSLLGMSWLKTLGRIELSGESLLLEQ